MLSTDARKRTVFFFLGVLIGLLAVGQVWTQAQIATTTQSIRETQKNSTATLRAIKDCTQTEGRCFQRGQRRTGRAVASINEVSIIAASCASSPYQQTVEQIRRCVIAELERRTDHR